ncbi:hypothetical protein EDB89DRAFT_2158016 [Lactarius sanguifluus]|nr:hypothetical protein EDB89DRAFT_2158016 [Lactarius sanguifluus]
MVFTLAYAIFDDFAKHLTQLPFSAIGYLWTILKFECRLRKSLPTLWGLASRHAPEPDVLKRWRETIENQVKTRRQWFSQGMRKSVKLCAYTADSTVVTSALEWTLTALDEDKEIEDFAARVPGFFDSRVVPDATLSVLPLMSHRPNANPIFGSRLYDLLKTCISETSPLDDKTRKNRLRVCMKYLWHFGQKYNELGPSQVLPSYFPDALASPGITRRIWLYGGDNVMSSLLPSAVFASLPVGRPGTYRLHLPLHAVVVWTGTYLYGLLDGGCTTWRLVVPPGTTHKVSNLAVAQAMSNPSKSFLHSDDQQAGQVQKVKKVIQVQSQQVTITLVVRAKVPQVLVVMWRGGGGGAGVVTWHSVDSLVWGGPAWRWRGVAWRGSRSWVGWVSLASRRVGGREVLRAVLYRAGGVGGNVGQSKRKGLVGSELAWWWAPRIALRVSSWRILYVAKAWRRGRILVKVDGDGGHEFITASGRGFHAAGYRWWRLMETGAHELTCGEAAVTWSVRNDTKKKKKILADLVVVSRGLGGFSHGGVMMVENLR